MNWRLTATITTSINLLLLLMATTSTTTNVDPKSTPPHTHNITSILAGDPRFSTFNHHLTTTGLAEFINNLTEVTVCALDNAAMAELLSLNPSPASIKRLLLFHLFSHSDPEMLNSCCAWTLYPRPSGMGNEVVDLMDIGDGKTSFTFPFTNLSSQLISFIIQIPPHLSVIHVSKVLPSPEAWSLISPIETLKIMSNTGCSAFARSIAENPTAEKWFKENAYVGMTVICPIDSAWERFFERFTEMKEEDKIDLLLFHSIPVYHDRCGMRGYTSDWRPATLLTYYRGNGVYATGPTVDMEKVSKLIAGAGYDVGPLAVYPIRGVLLPDDPVGVVDYLAPNEPNEPVVLGTEEECDHFPRFVMMAPEASPVDSGFEDNNVQ